MRGDPRRELPAVDRLLASAEAAGWVVRWGRAPVVESLREALSEARERLGASGEEAGEAPTGSELLGRARRGLEERFRPSLRPVLNATGVVLHTNLGRAPLARAALEAVRGVAEGYSNLELELAAGERGSRDLHCARYLRELTGSEDALVVNNNAAALVLVLNELALDREVVVSRGELVEIGGSFRLPELVERSGARLREVGTTNRTRLSDYRKPAVEGAGALLKVHPSNYRVQGFTSEVPLASLVRLGRELQLPVVHDLGSGLLLPEALEGFPAEPGPRASVEAGADLVTWSGDKLLGGPQAGIVHGSAAMIARLRGNPLMRAFRVGKMTLAALEATLRLHVDPELARREVPVLAMLSEPAGSVEARARRARERLGGPARGLVDVLPMTSAVGGGAYPELRLASAGWALPDGSGELERRCRLGEPPLLGRMREGELWLDFRTLRPAEEAEVATALQRAIAG